MIAGTCQYWRAEDEQGKVLWRKEAQFAGHKDSGEGITTASWSRRSRSPVERRRASRGRKFRSTELFSADLDPGAID